MWCIKAQSSGQKAPLREAELTRAALTVILVEFDQNRRRDHQEILQRRGGGVSDDGEALAQTP